MTIGRLRTNIQRYYFFIYVTRTEILLALEAWDTKNDK